MNREGLLRHIADVYGVEPDYPFEGTSEAAVFRHRENRRWFALLMSVPGSRLGRPEPRLDMVNLKCDPLLSGSLREQAGIYPAYHMNKACWISVVLDGGVPDDTVGWLIDLSFEMTAPRRRAPGKQR